MLVRRWLDEAGIHDPVLRHCYTVCVRTASNLDQGLARWWLIKSVPAKFRPHLAAMGATVYTADRYADTGPFEQRRDRLEEYAEATFAAIAAGGAADPILHAAAHTHHSFGLPVSFCEDMFDAARRDVDFVDFATYEELRWWTTRASGGPSMAWIWLLAGPAFTRAWEPVIREFGELVQDGDNLCDLADDLAQGRLYLPLEDLDRFGVRAEDMKAGRWTPGMAELLRFEVDRVTNRLPALAAQLQPYAPFASGLANYAERLLPQVLAEGATVLDRPTRLPFSDLVNVWQPVRRAMIPC
jgi:15-cis-phytoene synthase